jgi:hypothetical protein
MPVTADADSPDPGEDLSGTLRYIGMNMLARTRVRLANSPETREFLELGVALLRADLLDHTGPDIAQGVHSRLFESLSRERIISLAEERDTENSRLLGVNMFRHRWARKDFYTEDLIAYLFRVGPRERHFEEVADAARARLKEASLGQLIRLLCAAETEAVIADPLAHLQAIIQVALPKHPRVQEFSRAHYDYVLPRWAKLYEELALAYGLNLADGYTWNDVALLYNSIIEGVAVRARTEGSAPMLSNGQGVLEAAIIAMTPTFCPDCPQDLNEVFPVKKTLI